MQEIDYTKFKLKPKEELTEIVKDKDNIFVVSCNKCFKRFESPIEPEYEEFKNIVEEQGKTIIGYSQIDFLCNKPQTEKKVNSLNLSNSGSVIVISCGLGIQTVADLVDLPVYAGSDSVNQGGYHGIALSEKKCGACGQCYLNFTGGICPIVDCSKSLLNGPCGGTKNGKCEVDKNKDCGWDKIYKKLAQQNKLDEFVNSPTKIRDYSKINFKFINEYVTLIRSKRFEGFYGGIYPLEQKEVTENKSIVQFPEVDTVVIPLSQHAGAVCEPLVKVGDTVKTGQRIGDTAAYVGSVIHSSVSGQVAAIEPRLHPVTRTNVMSVVIKSDKINELDSVLKPYGKLEDLSAESIINLIREKGIVGLGGAGFPTAVKLNPSKPVDTVILNGCECEPMLTADYRVMMEYPDDVVFGLKTIMKAVNAKKGVIAIEDNKPEAVELLSKKVESEPDIEVVAVKTKYPQGAEKMLIKRVLGRVVPSGGLPSDVGVIVNNVSTAKAISEAINQGLPLFKRVITVNGKVKNPGNYEIKIGTSVKEILDYCGIIDNDALIKMGGPIMGIEINNLDVPVIKGTTGIVVVEKPFKEELLACIKCGRCVDVCPMELTPSYYVLFGKDEKWNEMEKYKVMDCIECGCCENICSSKSSLVSVIKKAKKMLREKK